MSQLGRTALMLAASAELSCCSKAVRPLVQQGADLNVQDNVSVPALSVGYRDVALLEPENMNRTATQLSCMQFATVCSEW